MANFDISNAAANAYKQTWASRDYLLRLAAVPVALKLLFFTLASAYGNDSYILFMLILVPALIAEGWMLAHMVRFIVLGQTWPFRPTGDMDADRAALSIRARGILSGMIVFVLINMAIGLLSHLVTTFMGPYILSDAQVAPEDIPAAIPLLSFALLVFMFWGFRLLWLHIPFALNMDISQFFSKLRGAAMTFRLIALWIVCFVPFLLLLQITVAFLMGLFPEDAGRFAVTIASVFVDTAKSIVATAGMTFAFRDIFAGGKTDRRV